MIGIKVYLARPKFAVNFVFCLVKGSKVIATIHESVAVERKTEKERHVAKFCG